MKIGFVSRIGMFPEKEWESEFKTANEHSLDHLELIVNYPYFGPSSYNQAQADLIRQLSKRYNVEIIMHLLPNQYGLAFEDVRKMFASTYGRKRFIEHENSLKNKFFNPASLDEKVRKFSIEEIKKTYELGKRIDAKIITIHGGSFNNFVDYHKNLKASRETLEELNPLFNKIKLCVENLPIKGHFGNLPKELPLESNDLLYLVDGLNNIGICFDIGHANNIQNPIDFYNEIKKSGKILDMHIHDNDGTADNHVRIGHGNIDFKMFCDTLLEDNYQGYFSIELDTWIRTPEPMIKDERISALKYLRRFL